MRRPTDSGSRPLYAATRRRRRDRATADRPARRGWASSAALLPELEDVAIRIADEQRDARAEPLGLATDRDAELAEPLHGLLDRVDCERDVRVAGALR